MAPQTPRQQSHLGGHGRLLLNGNLCRHQTSALKDHDRRHDLSLPGMLDLSQPQDSGMQQGCKPQRQSLPVTLSVQGRLPPLWTSLMDSQSCSVNCKICCKAHMNTRHCWGPSKKHLHSQEARRKPKRVCAEMS